MSSNETNVTRALRAAIAVTGLVSTVALSATLSGCTRLRDRVVDGRGFDGSECVGWSMQGSAEDCCNAQGGMLNTGPHGRSCVIVVEGPFVPPSMDA